jgi:hypothetical protein
LAAAIKVVKQDQNAPELQKRFFERAESPVKIPQKR